jgi:iron-sulfur cluster protein
MSLDERRAKAERIRHLLDTEGDAVQVNASLLNYRRYQAIDGLDDYEALRDEARTVKEDAIDRLPELVEQVREAVEARGGHVYVADDAADANRYIADVADDAEADSLVKSKSMTTEEIEVNDHLESRGVNVYETDLGEFVIQVADEAPSHLVGPAIHKSTSEISDLFEAAFDLDEHLEGPGALTEFARDYLGERIREADMGMTGANFVVAESGTVALVTNEGNARKCAVTPDTHVAVAGVEKLIPTIDDLRPFVELIGRAATGQDIAQYVSLLSPPVESPRLDFDAPDTPLSEQGGDREFHLVLLDNGRLAARGDDHLRETLYCIRCGACANSCANFQHVGGHAFGGETYTGGIATGWETIAHGQASAAEFNDLCTGCTRCVNNCPVKIDIPWINEVVRDRVNGGADPDAFDFLVDGLSPDAEQGGFDRQKRLFGNFGILARAGSATAPVSNWLADLGPVRAAMERVFGVDARRDLPEFQRETLAKWFEKRGPQIAPSDATREAVLYPDAYTNHVRVERGKAAVRVLEALGVHVRVPSVPESGRAPLSQGMIATADRQASRVRDALADHVAAGRDVVVVEPSDLAMFRRDYEHLLPADEYERLRDASFDMLEYVFGLLENGADADALPAGEGRTVGYHSHCQQRTLGLESYTEAVLSDLGYDLVTTDQECCGMAGSFGYKTEYYDLAMDVGEDVGDALADVDGPLAASGTSCAEQIADLLGREAVHPVELLDPKKQRK